MRRYDHNKTKKSGRYNPSKDKPSRGVNVFVVLILMLFAGTGGFFAERLLDDVQNKLGPEVRNLPIPIAPKNVDAPEMPQTADILKQQNDNIEELQPVTESPVLPELDSSDAAIRAAIIEIAPGLGPWLSHDQLIKTYLTIANDFSQGLRINKHLQLFKLDQPFTAEQKDTDLVIAANSYHRYDKLAQAIDTIDVQAVLIVYKKFRPLFLQVFNEFSYPPEYNLEDIIIKAAAEILAAPVLDQPIVLTSYASRYKFADPKLEALNPVHKQMIRMGPENTRIIQNKVRLLAEKLGDLNN